VIVEGGAQTAEENRRAALRRHVLRLWRVVQWRIIPRMCRWGRRIDQTGSLATWKIVVSTPR